ncbi:MAG: hypothetical protein V4719_12360 [Planctomycetota bacterium]
MSYEDENYRDNPSASPSDRDRYDDRYQDDRDQDDRQRTAIPGQPQPPNKGCSKGCLYGMTGCGCLMVLAIVVMGLVGWRMADMVIKGSSTDPAVIRAATSEMADLTPPKGLEPKMKLNILMAKVIIYESADGKSTLNLLQVNPQFVQKGDGKNQEFGQEFRKGFERGGRGGRGDNKEELTIVKSDTKEMKIRGQATKIKFSEAKNAAGAEFRMVDMEFAGKTGPVVMQLELPLEKYDEAEVNKFLESIK